MERHLRRLRGPTVAPFLRRWEKEQLVMRKADQALGPPALDGVVRELVRSVHVAGNAVHRGQVSLAPGWELAGYPGVGRIEIRLVDRAPQPDQVTELVDDPMHEGQKRMR